MGEANDLTAVVEAARMLPDVAFVLMGDGKRRAELERAAPANVRFRSGSKADVATLAAESNVCLTVFKDVPVLATNSPNKLFDTFAAGRPAIVNTDGWQRELVERNEAGVFAQPGDPGALAERVLLLRDDPELARRYGENARRLAEREFDRRLLAERLRGVLERAAGERR
jgi:glycosyltransferase involved in cell wall biosynthesis